MQIHKDMQLQFIKYAKIHKQTPMLLIIYSIVDTKKSKEINID